MKEKTVEEFLEELVHMCDLGTILADAEPVTGGLMHRMYKVITDRGVYAVKHLNAEIMKRPGVHENYARAEKIERILENKGIPIVPAIAVGGKKMQRIDEQYFYVFRWQEGKTADWNHISDEMCRKAGKLLGTIHAIEPQNIEPPTPETSHIDWRGSVRRAKEENASIAALLEENEELLVCAESELNRARASLPGVLCLSNEDMDPKNVMWDNGNPWMIDLECLDYGNPVSHVMQLALQWAGIVTCNMDMDKMTAFFDGYLGAYDNRFRGYSDVVGVAYTWVEWLDYNIQRALGDCVDEAERELGISEVRNTVERIKYIHKMVPKIREALDTRLPKTIEIRYVKSEDKEFWYRLDKHLPEQEFEHKVSSKRGYILLEDNKPIGLLRYNLFWDNTPFCTMLFIDWKEHRKGYGKKLMEYWENDMKSQGYGMLLTSTQVDEEAQHFYRKLGYKDCGGFVIDVPGYEQPMEMFLVKGI